MCLRALALSLPHLLLLRLLLLHLPPFLLVFALPSPSLLVRLPISSFKKTRGGRALLALVLALRFCALLLVSPLIRLLFPRVALGAGCPIAAP